MPQKGYKQTEEHRIKISKNKNTLGKHWKLSEETKKKQSESQKGKKKPPRTKEHSIKISEGNKGKKRTDEHKKRYSKAKKGQKGYWKDKKMSEEHKRKIGENNGSRRPEVRKKISETLKGHIKSEETKRKLRKWHINNPNKKFSGTTIELAIREELERRGYQKDIDYYCNIGLSNIANVDIYFPENRVVIECDGCFYHGCPIHHPEWTKNKERDEKKTNLLKYHGFNVYHFWEHEINESPKKCVDKILKRS
jgi:DNA mismatch endonuclease, patch repair protein